MSIDLTKLIAKKNYTVPVKAADLCNKVLEQLNVSDQWFVKTQRPRSAVLRLDWAKEYVAAKQASEKEKDKIKVAAAAREELLRNRLECIGIIQEATVDNVRVEVSYIVAEDSADRCVVKAACKPALYLKITRGLKYEQADLQDIRIQGEEFLDEIFIGGLGGKEIQEAKEVSR
jgi:hypothetical protein